MPELAETTTSTKSAELTPLQSDLWNGDHLSHLKDMLDKSAANRTAANKTELLVTRVSDTASAGNQVVLPKSLETDLKDLQKNLERTQKQIAELQQTCNSGLFDLELSRRSLTGNPYKILTAGTGLAVLSKSPGLATMPLTGVAALQGYDDFKNLREQTSFSGRGKYTLGLLADTAVGAGSLSFLTESVPMKYKAPLLIGGLLARAAIDFIPNRK